MSKEKKDFLGLPCSMLSLGATETWCMAAVRSIIAQGFNLPLIKLQDFELHISKPDSGADVFLQHASIFSNFDSRCGWLEPEWWQISVEIDIVWLKGQILSALARADASRNSGEKISLEGCFELNARGEVTRRLDRELTFPSFNKFHWKQCHLHDDVVLAIETFLQGLSRGLGLPAPSFHDTIKIVGSELQQGEGQMRFCKIYVSGRFSLVSEDPYFRHGYFWMDCTSFLIDSDYTHSEARIIIRVWNNVLEHNEELGFTLRLDKSGTVSVESDDFSATPLIEAFEQVS